MKNVIRNTRSKLASVLRPNQRRNWSQDQIYHYRQFLSDYKKIQDACDATINGFQIHNLLEKEIRNSYWIYRSSPTEQFVLTLKLLLRRAFGTRKVNNAPNAGRVATADQESPKAFFIVSPATGLNTLMNIATSHYEKGDVIFVSSGENSRVEAEIRRCGFELLIADNPDTYAWRPRGSESRFLKDLWKGLKNIQNLNYWQKLFVYLYTRSALKDLSAYYGFFSRQIKNSENVLFTGRPRTPFVNGAIVAGRESGAKVVFVSHTIWYHLPCPVGELYDLSPFSGAILLTPSCKHEVQRVNPHVDITVTGMEKPEHPPQQQRSSLTGSSEKLRVGMFLGVNDFIEDVIPELAKLDIEIWVKTRPPGGNASHFVHLAGQYANITICDHKEYPMDRFCNSIDLVVGGYSNAVFHAANLGVPVIGYLTPDERQANEFLSPVVIPYDVAILKAPNKSELIEILSGILNKRDCLNQLSAEQLGKVEDYIPNVDYSGIGEILDRRVGS